MSKNEDKFQPRHLTVSAVPERPVVLWDGDCSFCRRWVERFRCHTGEAVEFVSWQEARQERFPEIPEERCRGAVQFVDTDGRVSQGAEAAYRILAHAPGRGFWLWLYLYLPGFRAIAEWGYRVVAKNRHLFDRLTTLLWGRTLLPLSHVPTRWIFLRLLGLTHLIAFVSIWVQIHGLIGSRGILPIADFLEAAGPGVDGPRWLRFPTLCWWNASDGFLTAQCAAGAGLALLLMGGVAPPVCLAVLWVLYLSIFTAGRTFLGYQWDTLLLETTFISIFLGPMRLFQRPSRETPPSPLIVFLLRWLLFRLMFSSGFVKLASGDQSWWNLTALTHHYETQPLPTWTAWWIHQMPVWFHQASCALMFAVELILPFTFFMPRRLRLIGFIGAIALMGLVILTGNYGFFNILTIALAVMLLDDWFVPRRLRGLFERGKNPLAGRQGTAWRKWALAPVFAVLLAVSTSYFLLTILTRTAPEKLPGAAVWVARTSSPLRLSSTYGLFADMTEERPEIVVEGSRDGRDWRAYRFKWKPGVPSRRPAFCAPHMPRLDWQMWFAALRGSPQGSPWIQRFFARLLEGEEMVLDLLEENPFPDEPPRYLRARYFDYRFTTLEERRETGNWWSRELKGNYLSPVSMMREHR